MFGRTKLVGARAYRDRRTNAEVRIAPVRPLSGGAQGDASVVDVEGRGRFVIKVLHDAGWHSPGGAHLAAFADRVRGLEEATIAQLHGLPIQTLTTPEGRPAALMRLADGIALGDAGAYKQLPSDLPGRLATAATYAARANLLHSIRLVSADPSDENTVLVPEPSGRMSAALVDLDAGGALDASGTYAHGVRPVAGYRPDGSLVPPEHVMDPTRVADVDSDRWAFANMLFRLTSGGVDPFPHARTVDDLVLGRVVWPPQSSDGSTMCSYFEPLRHRLGPIWDLFGRTFARPQAGWDPAVRTPMAEWQRALEAGTAWAWRCKAPSCGAEYVRLGRTTCPHCGAPAEHATVTFGGSRQEVTRDGVHIRLSTLGLPGPDQVAVRLRREAGALLLDAAVPVRMGDAWLGPGTQAAAAVPRGRALPLRIWPANGWGASASLVLHDPA